MEYQTPSIAIIEHASEAIEVTSGPSNDGGGYAFSFGWNVSLLEAEPEEK